MFCHLKQTDSATVREVPVAWWLSISMMDRPRSKDIITLASFKIYVKVGRTR